MNSHHSNLYPRVNLDSKWDVSCCWILQVRITTHNHFQRQVDHSSLKVWRLMSKPDTQRATTRNSSQLIWILESWWTPNITGMKTRVVSCVPPLCHCHVCIKKHLSKQVPNTHKHSFFCWSLLVKFLLPCCQGNQPPSIVLGHQPNVGAPHLGINGCYQPMAIDIHGLMKLLVAWSYINLEAKKYIYIYIYIQLPSIGFDYPTL